MKKIMTVEELYKKIGELIALGHGNVPVSYDIDQAIKLLKEQIEKMKCCENCENWNWKHSKCKKKLKGDCFKHSKWIMRNF